MAVSLIYFILYHLHSILPNSEYLHIFKKVTLYNVGWVPLCSMQTRQPCRFYIATKTVLTLAMKKQETKSIIYGTFSVIL